MRLAFYKDEYEAYLREEEKAKLNRARTEKIYENWQNQYRLENGYILYPMTEQPVMRTPFEVYVLGKPTKEKTTFGKEKETMDDMVNSARRQEEQALANTQNFWDDVERAGISPDEVKAYIEGSFETEVPEIVVPEIVVPPYSPIYGGSGRGNQRDMIKEVTLPADVLHEQKLAELEKEKPDLTEADYNIKKAEEVKRYCEDLKKSLDDLKSSTKETETDLIQKITEKEAKIEKDIATADQAINAAKAFKAEKKHADELQALETAYKAQEFLMAEHLQKQEKTQGEAEIYMLAVEKKFHEDQLKELERYKKEVETSEYLGAEERKERLEELNEAIRSTERQILTDTGKFSAELREMMNNPFGAGAIKRNYEEQIVDLTRKYDEMLKHVQKDSDEAVALEAEKNRRILLLNTQMAQELIKLQEKVGLSWADEYNLELSHLQELHAQGLLSEKEYQRKRLELGVANAKQYFDYYAGLSGTMFQAIQDAEIAMSDAKYDVLIRQAQNNGEETAQLEEEKQNK